MIESVGSGYCPFNSNAFFDFIYTVEWDRYTSPLSSVTLNYISTFPSFEYVAVIESPILART